MLAAFLAHADRPSGTLRYHELQGFLFVVATSPDLIRPSEWMPLVFGDGEPVYDSMEEANAVIAEIMATYNDVASSVRSSRPALPFDCPFLRPAAANLDDGAPVAQWSRGFLLGYQWLEDEWADVVPDDYRDDFAGLLVPLTFFSSRTLAVGFAKELGHPDVEAFAPEVQDMFPAALDEWCRIASILQDALAEPPVAEPRVVPVKTGRNDPCPCGSGRKYKKCCGALAH